MSGYNFIYSPTENKQHNLYSKDGIQTLYKYIYHISGGGTQDDKFSSSNAIKILENILKSKKNVGFVRKLYKKYDKIMEILEYQDILELINKKKETYEIIVNSELVNDSIKDKYKIDLSFLKQSNDTYQDILELKKKELLSFEKDKEKSDLALDSKGPDIIFNVKLTDYETGFQQYFYNGSSNIDFNLKINDENDGLLKEFNPEDLPQIEPLKILDSTSLKTKIPILNYLLVKDENDKLTLYEDKNKSKSKYLVEKNQKAFVCLHNTSDNVESKIMKTSEDIEIEYIPIGLILKLGFGARIRYISRIFYRNKWWNIDESMIPEVNENTNSQRILNDSRIYAVFYVQKSIFSSIDFLVLPHKPRFIVSNEETSYFTSLLQNLFYIDYVCRSLLIRNKTECYESNFNDLITRKINKYLDLIYTKKKTLRLERRFC